MSSVIERARVTVDQLLATRHQPRSYEEQCRYAAELVDLHLHEENPERIDECLKLYTEDAVWECPARRVTWHDREGNRLRGLAPRRVIVDKHGAHYSVRRNAKPRSLASAADLAS